MTKHIQKNETRKRKTIRKVRKAALGAAMVWNTGCGGCENSEPSDSLPTPVLSQLEPEFGIPGAEIEITGQNLKTAGKTVVHFTGGTAPLIVLNNLRAKVEIPQGAKSGPVMLVAEQSKSTSLAFEVTHIDTAPWLTVAAGSFHTCATKTSGDVYCWGANKGGQLGIGLKNERSLLARPVSETTNFTNLAAGDYLVFGNTCGVQPSGALFCWGDNGHAQLGDGSRIDRLVPKRAGGDQEFTTISMGGYHACGLSDGLAYCWGTNEFGELGLGAEPLADSPAKVTDTVFQSLEVGSHHTCGVSVSGALYCWGDNKTYELGNGTDARSATPLRIGIDSDWATVAPSMYADEGATCALKTNGTLWCWGSRESGQIGGELKGNQKTPIQFSESSDWASVSMGLLHTCAIKTDRTLWCWGDNTYGQLGLGKKSTTPELLPVQVGGDNDWRSVTLGALHACAVKESGKLYCWGSSLEGQLGVYTGKTEFVPAPREVTELHFR